MRNALIMTTLAALLAAGAGQAQIALDPNNKWSVEWNARLGSDFPYLARYAPANAALVPTPGHPRIVFMGDSITENWFNMAGDFFTPGRIGRGIGGQTTPQMLLRFRQDVIELHPAVVQIMAGTNDIAGNTGPMTPEQTQANIKSMVELAHAHGIRVILASAALPGALMVGAVTAARVKRRVLAKSVSVERTELAALPATSRARIVIADDVEIDAAEVAAVPAQAHA